MLTLSTHRVLLLLIKTKQEDDTQLARNLRLTQYTTIFLD